MAFRITLYEQTVLFVYALVFGIIIGVLYDVFRISRIMLTGTGIGGYKTESHRIEAITQGILSEIGKKSENKIGKIKGTFIFVAIFIQDILFFLIVAVAFTVFLYQANYGQSRLYVYLSSVIGFLLYYNTIGRLSAKVSGFAVSLIKLLFVFFLYRLFKPGLLTVISAVSVPIDAVKLQMVMSLCERKAVRLSEMSKNGFGYTKTEVFEGRKRHENKQEPNKRLC